MTHGDDSGLILPPRVAPIQVVIIPAAQHKEGVLEAAGALRDRLTSAGIRVKLDDSENSAGWKFSQYEMKGVPVRLEIGPRDIAANSCVLVSRVTREKKFVSLDNITDEVNAMLNQVMTTSCLPVRRKTWRKRPSWRIPTRSSWTLPPTIPAISKRCGAAKPPVRTS